MGDLIAKDNQEPQNFSIVGKWGNAVLENGYWFNQDQGNLWLAIEDDNGNGVRDEDEDGLSGWTIEITDGDEFNDSTVTDENGAYSSLGSTT